MRLRSTVTIPAGSAGLDAALESAADAIALSLVDASRAVGALRSAALEALPRIAAAGKVALVAVNHPRTRLLRDDLDAIVTPLLGGVLLPHAVEPQDVRDLAVLLREFEYNRGIEPGAVRALPVIDTARGLLRAAETAQAAPRVAGLVFAAAAYARDVGARHEERGSRLAYAQGAVVAAARAFDVLPLVVAGPLELLHWSQCGFSGALLPDPGGVTAANAAFTPTRSSLDRARSASETFEAARAEGAWVARAGHDVVDAHTARKARQVLDHAPES